ncbi:hypothetical protein BDR26DRAFT_859197 [Obelidium mucronatum]|nr:hypothetical protein BDR26DRAFT_859197 [Obelidium mucronatum]
MEEDGINVIPDNQEKQTQECKDAAAAAVVVEDSDSDMEEQVDELQCPQMYPPSFIVQPDSASSEGDTNNNCKNTSNTESTDLMNSDAMIIDSPPPIPSDLPNKTMICKINSSNENTTSNSNSASQGDDEINASCSIDTAAITTAAGGGAVTSSSNPENCAVGDNVGDDTQKEPASDEGLVVEPKPVRASRKKRKTVSLERGGLQLMDLPGGMRDFDDDFGFGIDVRMESRMEETSEKNHPIIKRIKKEKRGMFPAELGTTVLVLNHPGSIKVWHHEHALAGRGDDDDADSFLLL